MAAAEGVTMTTGKPPMTIGKPPMTNEAFLAVCIKHAKDKLVVDFDKVAEEVGMSRGGAK